MPFEVGEIITFFSVFLYELLVLRASNLIDLGVQKLISFFCETKEQNPSY